MTVEVQDDPADERRQIALFALFRELDLRVHHLAEVACQAIELALCRVAHLLPQTVGTVVQDDLHNPSVSRTLELV